MKISEIYSRLKDIWDLCNIHFNEKFISGIIREAQLELMPIYDLLRKLIKDLTQLPCKVLKNNYKKK